MADDDIQTLTQFNLAETDDGYLLEIGGSDGGLLRVAASPEQIDAIIDALDALLSEDEAAVDEVGDAD
ncbi:MAG: hypothetical protein V4701_04465 [Pseudomonadota bacterium]